MEEINLKLMETMIREREEERWREGWGEEAKEVQSKEGQDVDDWSRGGGGARSEGLKEVEKRRKRWRREQRLSFLIVIFSPNKRCAPCLWCVSLSSCVKAGVISMLTGSCRRLSGPQRASSAFCSDWSLLQHTGGTMGRGGGGGLAGERHNTRPPTISRDPVDWCHSVCYQSLNLSDIKNTSGLLFLWMTEEEEEVLFLLDPGKWLKNKTEKMKHQNLESNRKRSSRISDTRTLTVIKTNTSRVLMYIPTNTDRDTDEDKDLHTDKTRWHWWRKTHTQ